jgi:hypothetical protein
MALSNTGCIASRRPAGTQPAASSQQPGHSPLPPPSTLALSTLHSGPRPPGAGERRAERPERGAGGRSRGGGGGGGGGARGGVVVCCLDALRAWLAAIPLRERIESQLPVAVALPAARRPSRTAADRCGGRHSDKSQVGTIARMTPIGPGAWGLMSQTSTEAACYSLDVLLK